MTAKFSITSDDEFSGATLFVDGEVFTISDTHPAYAEIVGMLLDHVDDDAKLLGLINPAIEASRKLVRLSERVSIRGNVIFFDGDAIESSVGEHIADIFKAGGNETQWGSLVKFLEKVATNPSKKSQRHLYEFVNTHGLTVTEYGDIVAYKGVDQNGYSIHAGYGIVNGEEFGAVDEDGNLVESSKLLNEVNSIVEIPRSMVDSDRGVACSTGLHVGTYEYAQSFGARLLTVLVNPRDVVSVPEDYNNAKVRVSRYTVLEINGGKYTTPTVYVSTDTEEAEEEDFDESFDYEPNIDEDPDEYEDTDALLGVVLPVADDEEELSDEEIRINAKLEEFTKVIQSLPVEGLRRHRNKRITAKNRPLFDQAVTDLGLTY